ncbi:MAG: hypothetical protein DUD34_15885, partial [Lactobacillus sp.]
LCFLRLVKSLIEELNSPQLVMRIGNGNCGLGKYSQQLMDFCVYLTGLTKARFKKGLVRYILKL